MTVWVYFALDGPLLKPLVSFKAAPTVRRASCDVASIHAERRDQPDWTRPASVAHKVGCVAA